MTNSVKNKSLVDEYSIYGDLCPIVENKLPSLNSVVALSLGEGSSSLSVKICSCNLTNCKLLHNFLNIAEKNELEEMDQLLEKTKKDLQEKLAQLEAKQHA